MKYLQFSHTLAVIMVLGAFAAVGGFGWLVYDFFSDRTALAELQFSYEEAVQKNTYAASIRALLRDIEKERAELDGITQGYDPVETIRIIEEAGRTAGVTVTVNAVTSGTPAPEDPTLTSFVINLDMAGPFERMHRFAALMETLPLPAEIEQARFEKLEKTWNGGMIIRVYMVDGANDN